MSAPANYLNEVGRQIVKSVNSAVAYEKPLRKQWDPQKAERARTELCKVLAISQDDKFWAELGEAISTTPDSVFAEELQQLDLDRFEDFEMQMLLANGADRDVATEWAQTTVLLLSTIRTGFTDNLPPALRANAARAREFVQLAHHDLCVKPLRLASPQASNKKRFRKKLWAAITLSSGLGTMTLNGAFLLGAPASGGITAIFGAHSLLGGFAQLIVGGKSVHELASKDDS